MTIVGDDIKDLLEGESSLGLTYLGNMFVGHEPPEPDNTVTIYDISGSPPQTTFQKGENYFYDSIQIRIRNNNYKEAGELAHDIVNFLHRRAHFTINGVYYSAIDCSIPPAFLDRDENGRARWVVSFDIQRR